MENKCFISSLLNQFSAANDTQIAFSVYDGYQLEDITYRQFLNDILKRAGYFIANQITGRHVAIAASNSYEWLVVFCAISATGNTVVLLNPDLPADVLMQECVHADVSMICTEQRLVPECVEAGPVKWVSFPDLTMSVPMSLESVCVRKPDETIVMMFTSGTTGKSKVVEFSVENIVSYMDDLDETFLPDRVLLVVPLHHILGLNVALCRLWRLHTVCLGRGIRYMIADMPKLNPKSVPMVPTVLESLVKLLKCAKTEEQRKKYIGNNLVHISVGGASAKFDLCRYMMNQGIIVQSAYGMTEATGAGTSCIWQEDNIGTIGKSYGRTQVRIQDGELQLKGPAVMKGYYKDPEETAKVIEDGWLHTGDMGYCDENGYYYITGRKKNVIILSNGENVNPEEIEAKWGTCTHILECMVYSDGKGICADVYTENKDAAAAYIKEYNNEMPMYRQVYKVNYSSEPLEKTSTGKIKRKENK